MKRANVQDVQISEDEWFIIGQTVRLKEYPSLQGMITEITVPFKGAGSTLVKIRPDDETLERLKYNMPQCCGNSWPIAKQPNGRDHFFECRDVGLPIWRWERIPRTKEH